MNFDPDPFSTRAKEEELYEWLSEVWILPCEAWFESKAPGLGKQLRGFCMFGPPICIVPIFMALLISTLMLGEKCIVALTKKRERPKAD